MASDLLTLLRREAKHLDDVIARMGSWGFSRDGNRLQTQSERTRDLLRKAAAEIERLRGERDADTPLCRVCDRPANPNRKGAVAAGDGYAHDVCVKREEEKP